jgi:hypothetical protein
MDRHIHRQGAPTILLDYQNLSGHISHIPVDVLRSRIEDEVPQLRKDLELLKDELSTSTAEIRAATVQASKELADFRNKSDSELLISQQKADENIKNAKHGLEDSIGKAFEKAVTDLSNTKEQFAIELVNTKHELLEKFQRSEKQSEIEEGGQNADVDDEPGIAVENQLRIKEQSAKAIDIYMNTLLSTVWIGCSKNTYGNHRIESSVNRFKRSNSGLQDFLSALCCYADLVSRSS